MKIKFRINIDYEKTATLEVVVKYTDFYSESEETAKFAEKKFDGNASDEKIAEWAAKTIANCLGALIPEDERYGS